MQVFFMPVAGLKAKISCIVILVFLLHPALGQSPLFQSYHLQKKNEPVNVNKILQDKTGFIWFATDKGLFKFDGVNYKSIIHLPDRTVTALAQDAVGRIWAGFKNGKITVIEKNVAKPFEPAEGMPSVQISDILFDKEGVLWFSTYSDGIYYYVNDRLYRLDDMDGMPDLYVYDLEEDTKGNIWAGTDGGVAICSRNKNAATIQTINYSKGLPDNIIKKIAKGQTGTMLLATEDAGIISLDMTSSKIKPLIIGKWDFGSIVDFLSADDWIWVATARGLASIDMTAKVQLAKIQSPDPAIALFHDDEGSIWVGSQTGVKRTMGRQIQLFEPDGDRNVIAVTVGRDGDLWFSTAQGLFRRTPKITGDIVSTRPLAGTEFMNRRVISLFTDSEGFVWSGFYGEGVIRINPDNGEIKSFGKELRNGSVLNISGKNKAVWLATLGGATEIRLDKNFTTRNYSTTDGLATDYIYQAFADSQNRIWFATDRDGVDMLDTSGLHHFKENLSSKVVYGLAEDSLHHVWANVQDAGLFFFDGKQFKPFEKQNRMHNVSFNSFSSGSNGQLIAVHDLGIDILEGVENKFYCFGEEVGMHNKVPNVNAIASDERGGVFIGTNSGLISFYQRQNKKQDSPVPFIDQLDANDLLVDLKKSEQLNYDQNDIRISFTGFWYQNANALNFSYQLEGYDRGWISTEDRSVIYSKLPPGEYSFKLKVSDSNNFSGSMETKIHFVIKPPFWETTWFYIFAVLAVSFWVYSFIRFRERKLLKDKRELEARVKARTEEIQLKTEEIKTQAEEIKGINENLESLVKERTSELEIKNKALEQYAFINAHKLRAPVASILGLINLMKNVELRENDKVYLEHLNQSAKNLDAVVSSITEALEQGDSTKFY
jgi:ligand-binding sensor domain-containing protein